MNLFNCFFYISSQCICHWLYRNRGITAHGHIAQYLGDGLLVYFGYPIAYEDAAIRAVSCGLDIINAMSKVRTADGQVLKVRIGVHTGRVVIGEIGGLFQNFDDHLVLMDKLQS